MPVGKNKVPMARLRSVLTDAGFDNVRTYIASGNVLLESRLPAQTVAVMVHDLIKDRIGPDVPVIVRTTSEIQSLLARNPFGDGYDPARLFFVLFASTPETGTANGLRTRNFGDEALALYNDGAIMYIPGPYGKGTLSSMYLEKQLGISATMRNLNTINKLVELGGHKSN